MKILAAAFLLTSLAACDPLPRDPDGTSERVRTSRVMRVGLVEPMGKDQAAPAKALLVALAKATGARAATTRGAAEPLLQELKADRLDLVIGPFAKDTPWATEVALAPPIAVRGSGDDAVEVRAAMASGENAWVMLVENSSRAVAPAASAQE